MGNRALGHRAVLGSNDDEKQMKTSERESERKYLRDQILMEVFTYTNTHIKTCTDTTPLPVLC